MAKSKACTIRGFTYRHNGSYYINCETTDLSNIWTTMVPENYDFEERGEPTPLCVFESIAEANNYLKQIRRDTKVAGDDISWYIDRLSSDKKEVNNRIRLSKHKN